MTMKDRELIERLRKTGLEAMASGCTHAVLSFEDLNDLLAIARRGEKTDELRMNLAWAWAALRTIREWKDFPETGMDTPDGRPMGWGECWGSNGERDYMRAVASGALEKMDWRWPCQEAREMTR